jgi:hypothetical protein
MSEQHMTVDPGLGIGGQDLALGPDRIGPANRISPNLVEIDNSMARRHAVLPWARYLAQEVHIG